MNLLDQLRALRNAPQAIWLEFIGDYVRGGLDLYLFFEGYEDISFYLPHLRVRWSQKGRLHAYYCGGKDRVIGLMQRVKSTLDQEWRGLFFVDKDLDDFATVARTTDRYLYETECYAVENYVASSVAISVVWTDLFKLPATDPRLTAAIDAYERAFETFADVMRTVTAWVLFLRKSHSVVLNSVSIDKIVHLDSDCLCVLCLGWAEHIMAASNINGVAYDVTAAALLDVQLRSVEPKRFIRGKFDLWFFVKFIDRVASAIEEPAGGKKYRGYQARISRANAVDILSPRMPVPQRLIEFLDRVLPV